MSFIYALSFVGFFVGIIMAFFGLKPCNRYRSFKNHPFSQLSEITKGRAKIKGLVMPEKGGLLKSPVSGIECVYYYVYVKNINIGASLYLGPNMPKTIKREAVKSFYLKRGNDAILIDPKDADVEAKRVFEHNFLRNPKELPKNVELFLKSEGEWMKGGFILREFVIEPGDECIIFGTFKSRMFKKWKNSEWLFITNKPEQDIVTKWKNGLKVGFAGIIILGFSLAGLIISYTMA